MKWLCSDQGSHFKNSLIESLTREFHISHHFVTAYSPWANGSIERICREVLRGVKALCCEWRLALRYWPAVVESLQSILNHSSVARLGLRSRQQPGVYRTPLEVFTEQVPVRPLMRALPIVAYQEASSDDEVRLKQLLKIDKLQSELTRMHRDVKRRADKNRKRHIYRHNRQTNIQPIDFTEGDFVLVRKPRQTNSKLQFSWSGPRRVVRSRSELVFEIEDLLRKTIDVVHARRMLLYRAGQDWLEISPELLRAAEHTDAQYERARELLALRKKNDVFEIQVE